jgi:hypothetical protein
VATAVSLRADGDEVHRLISQGAGRVRAIDMNSYSGPDVIEDAAKRRARKGETSELAASVRRRELNWQKSDLTEN